MEPSAAAKARPRTRMARAMKSGKVVSTKRGFKTLLTNEQTPRGRSCRGRRSNDDRWS
jgi:hypothetical protein